jgi:hypothetical protein
MSEHSQIHIVLPGHDGSDANRDLRRLTEKIHKLGLADASHFGFAGEFGYGCDFENDTFEMHWYRWMPRCDCGGGLPIHDANCDTVTKFDAWSRAFQCVGMVKGKSIPKPEGREETPTEEMMRIFSEGSWHSTPTTNAERDAWLKVNPAPSCSCGKEAEWVARNGPVPQSFDEEGDSKYTHTTACDWYAFSRPTFLHKPSGSTVQWYKSIGRDMEYDLKVEWSTIIRECMASLDPVFRDQIARGLVPGMFIGREPRA